MSTEESETREIQWFGSSWGAPLNRDGLHAPTPVGEPCSRCGEDIAAGDRGVNMWHIEAAGEGYRPKHAECHVRSFAGPIDHVLHHGLGSCDAKCLDDPEWLTPRESAEFVARLVAFYQTRVPR